MSFDKKNFLVADVLPYEIPLLYSNLKLMNRIKGATDWENIDFSKMTIDQTVPYQFSVWKNDHSKRTLSLLHPLSQLQMLRFVELYDQDLINYCHTYAIFSIRYPSGINKAVLKRDKLKKRIQFILEEDTEFENNDLEHYVDSYFEKKKFKKITDFYGSNLFKRLETKYSYLLKLDIQSCFDHIYTHTLDWAYLGEKELAKELRNERNRFSSLLDQIMQKANYNETNGIVVGPEFSRCVAEIILMRVDYLVYQELQATKGIRYRQDFEIVRYIDDIFIFCNDPAVCQKIQRIYEEKCKYYKLQINDSKVFLETRPFLRNSTWVPKLRTVLNQYFENYSKEKNPERDLPIGLEKKSFKRANLRMIEEVRSIMVDYESEIEKIVSYIFTSMENQMETTFKYLNGFEMEEERSYFLCSLIDVIHYTLVFSVTAPHVLKYVLFMTKFYSYAESNQMTDAVNLLYKKSLELLKYNKEKNMELLNLIIFMRRFRKDLPEGLLIEYIEKDPRYFTLASAMFYISTNDRRYRFKQTRQLINKIVYQLAADAKEKYFSEDRTVTEKEKDARNFLTSESFYPIHDFYNHSVLTKDTNSVIGEIKDLLSGVTWHPRAENKLFSVFWDYVKEFNKPFMKFDAKDDELVPYLILKTSHKFENRVSG